MKKHYCFLCDRFLVRKYIIDGYNEEGILIQGFIGTCDSITDKCFYQRKFGVRKSNLYFGLNMYIWACQNNCCSQPIPNHKFDFEPTEKEIDFYRYLKFLDYENPKPTQTFLNNFNKLKQELNKKYSNFNEEIQIFRRKNNNRLIYEIQEKYPNMITKDYNSFYNHGIIYGFFGNISMEEYLKTQKFI